MRGDPAFDITDMREGAVPPHLQFRRDQPVLGIGGVILPESPVGGVVGSFQIAAESVSDLVAATGCLHLGLGGGSDRARPDDTQECFLNRIIDAQPAEGYAARLAIVEQAPPAGIARNVVLGARVAHRELAAAAPAADKPREQRVAMLGRPVMPARGYVIAHHLADRLRPLPTNIALMGARDQRQPFLPRPALDTGSNGGRAKSRRDTSLTIGVGAAVDRVLDHPVDGRIARPAPDDVAIVAPGRQIQAMLEKPHQCLTGAAEFSDLVEHKSDGLLHAAIGGLLKAITDLHEANRGCDDEFAAAGLLVAGRERTLAQKIEFILVEASLQPQQQPVIALTRCIDRLLVDQHGVDDAAHLDELLPVAAVAGKARHLPRRNRPDLAETDFGDHPIEARAWDAASGRTAEIIIDRLNARPAKRRQAVAHGILKRAALATVQDLMG